MATSNPNLITIPPQTTTPSTSVSYTLTEDDIGKVLLVQTSNRDLSPGSSSFNVIFTCSDSFLVNSICYLKNADLAGNTITIQFVNRTNNSVSNAFGSPYVLPSIAGGSTSNASLMVLQCVFGQFLACY